METFSQIYYKEILNLYGENFFKYSIFMNFLVIISFFCIFAFSEIEFGKR